METKNDVIHAPVEIIANDRLWYYQEFDRWDGSFDAVNLYDEDGDFVCEFESMEELLYFIEGVQR